MSKLEKEYRFYLLNRDSILLNYPRNIGEFELFSSETLYLTDLLVERSIKPLKDSKEGIRVRKKGSAYEFTYKKFLGTKNGIASFKEENKDISVEIFKQVMFGNVKAIKDPIIDTLSCKGSLYVLMQINNTRKVLIYKFGDTVIEVIFEDIIYSLKNKKVKDQMLEIEIKNDGTYAIYIPQFIQEFTKDLLITPAKEGKNIRGMNLLGIS